MPRTPNPGSIVSTLSEREAALIARALHEAADRHINPHGVAGFDFHNDAAVGREMLALIKTRFPDARGAFARAETLRRAIKLGFLPPPRGSVMAAAVAFLDQHEATEAALAESFSKLTLLADGSDADLPF